ncbi:hypothetical protein AVEN_217932-1 [Araneus ventricosus]|uniref:Uncharacterized protein n=1 Tax=Araneus ventricosus TaxID=182803 RepID=A0A4Y2W1C4_ARAVE|nr:hypothetical protein AVEN_217932-1 [Araneus ventricosus]
MGKSSTCAKNSNQTAYEDGSKKKFEKMKPDSVFFVAIGEPPLIVRKDNRGISKKYPAENVSTESLEGARAELPNLWYAYPWGYAKNYCPTARRKTLDRVAASRRVEERK